MSGLLNKIVADGTPQLVATVPTGISFAALNILAANDNATDATLRVWIGTDATPSQADLVEPGVVIGGKGRYEDSVRIASPAESIFVQATAGVVIRVENVAEA